MTGPAYDKRELLRRLLQERAAKQEMKPAPPQLGSAPAMHPVPRNGDMELSFGQEMIWLLEQIMPEAMFYNVVERFEVRGRLDVDLLQRAIDEVIRRHEILRTTYLNVSGQPVQKIQPQASCRLRLYDVRHIPAADREQEVRRLIIGEVRTRFDLAVGPLMRPMLLQLTEDDFVFALVMHHITIDGYSLWLIVNEIASFYTAIIEHRIPNLPALPVQFADFAHWQRRWLSGSLLTKHRDYWRGKLGQNPPVLNLPTDYAPPLLRNFASATHHVSVVGNVVEGLKEIGRQQEATLFTVLLAAFGTLLMRYAGQDDFVIGGVISDRVRPEIEHAVGFFVNSLALRLDVSGDPSFHDLVARTRGIVFEAQEHGVFPFHRLVEVMQPKRSANSNPFAQVFVNMLNLWEREAVALPGASIRPLGGLDLHMPVDVFTLFAAVSGSKLELTFVYSTELFKAETIERMGSDFQNLLIAAASSPQTRLMAFPVRGSQSTDRVDPLMRQLTELGVRLTVEDGRLKVNAPKGVITDSLKSALSEHRSKIIQLLGQETQLRATTEPALRPVERIPPLPLTAVQRRFWFLDRIGQSNGHPNVAIPLRLEGDVDAVAMRAALMLLFERHELLRLRLGDNEGEPYPEIGSLSEDIVRVVDLTCWLKAEAEEEGGRLCRELFHTRFDLVNGPVARALVVRVASDVNLVIICMHHIVADGWSSSIIARELRETYTALKRGGDPGLAPLALQYVDYAAFETALVRSGLFERQLAYWKTKLKGAAPILALPTDHPRRSQQSLQGGRYDCIVEPDLLQRIEQFSHRHDTTLFMTMLAAFGVVLHRWTGQDDIVVGTPIANRANPDLERIVGPFVNNLSLRLDASGQPRFTDYLAQIRRTVIEAIDHRDLPFDMVVEAINPTRTLNHAPIFQVMFALHNFPIELPRFDDLTVSLIIPETKVARLDILLDMAVHEGRLHGAWEYDAELFDRSTIERMHAGLIEVVKGFLAAEEMPLNELPLRSMDEDRLLDKWNSTGADHDRGVCVHHLFERVARLMPQAPAVVVGTETFSYGEIDARANRLAHLLRRRGVDIGDRVALCLERTIDMPIALAAVLKAGAAYVPLDPVHPAERVRHVIEDAQVACVITTSSLEGVLPQSGIPKICLDVVAAELASLDCNAPNVAVNPEHLAYIIYTSGSTGRPKGVEVEQRNLVSFIAAMQREPGLAASDVLLAVTTLAFDIAGLEFWLPLSVGGKIVLASRADGLEGSRLNDLIAQHGVTMMQATPSTWRLMIGAGFAGKPDLKALCGGEALPPDLSAELVPRVAELWNMYGPTETTIWSTASRVAGGSVPAIGRPIANTRVYVVEPSGQLAAIGGLGELLIGGEGVARGYWNRPELTAERFVTIRLPGGALERVYRTGDIVRFRNDGQLEFHGRRDHQIKLRGYRIEPGEIEATLVAEAPIESCVVVVREDDVGDPRLVAYVVTKPGATFNREDARIQLKAQLPSYMVPSDFVVLNSLPLTPNGKVDRAALPAPTASGGTAQKPLADIVMTPVQQRVAELWCKVLRVDRVSLYDNFFDVGGHSMLVVRLHVALQQEFETDMALAELFQRTTVAAQAERMSMAGRGDAALRRAEARVRKRLHG